ncbi:hypothetical protein SDC9_71025 [bioreactor metagenome]|uniref:Uncharacterized protein n=1 Tax=bioreactor metagenome TaxID=1076179 RepID=A0A644Y7G6_9ZZZZ
MVAGSISRLAGFNRDTEQPIGFLECCLNPGKVLLKDGNNVFQPLLVADLVVETMLYIGKQRGGNSLRIGSSENGLAIFDRILTTNGAVGFLLLIKIVEQRKRRIILVAIHQKQGGKAR